MTTAPRHRRTGFRARNWVTLVALCTAGLLPLSASEADDLAAVYSTVSNGYVRTRLPDNTYKPETYTFGEGGRWEGPMRDKSIDDLPFLKIAGMIAGPLARQGYVPATDPLRTDLLIVVYWGTTTGTATDYNATPSSSASLNTAAALAQVHAASSAAESQSAGDALDSALPMLAMENELRDRNNYLNARILGFHDAFDRAQSLPSFSFSHDLMAELEVNRYFVVLRAYDFQLAWKEKKRKRLWEARFSIREQGSDFGRQLLAMAQSASYYFGQASGGLVRRNLVEGTVTIGTPKVIEAEPAKK